LWRGDDEKAEDAQKVSVAVRQANEADVTTPLLTAFAIGLSFGGGELDEVGGLLDVGSGFEVTAQHAEESGSDTVTRGTSAVRLGTRID
jgi:hypothetical protein